MTVKIVGNRLVISVDVETLVYAVMLSEQGFKITDESLAAKEILRELKREEEDGTTSIHRLFDKAAFDAWENGGEGFAEASEEDYEDALRRFGR